MAISFKAVRSDTKMVDALVTQTALKKNMKIYCDLLIKELREDYNRVPEGPNYIRKYKPSNRVPTNTLHPRGRRPTSQGAAGVGVGGGWHSSVSGDGQIGEVWNDVPYAKYVQGHKGEQSFNNLSAGWRSIDTVARQTLPVFNKLAKDSVEVGVAAARRERNRKGQFV